MLKAMSCALRCCLPFAYVCVCVSVSVPPHLCIYPRAFWVERYRRSPTTRQSIKHHSTSCHPGDGKQYNGWREWKEKDWNDRTETDGWKDWKDWVQKEDDQQRSQETWRSWKEWADREQAEDEGLGFEGLGFQGLGFMGCRDQRCGGEVVVSISAPRACLLPLLWGSPSLPLCKALQIAAT